MNELNYIELYNKKVPQNERVLEYKICSRTNCDGYDFCYECAGAGGYTVAKPAKNIQNRPDLSLDVITSIRGTIERINKISRLLNDKENLTLLKHYQKLLEHPRTPESISLLKQIKKIRSNEIKRKAIFYIIKFLNIPFQIEIDLETEDDIWIKSTYPNFILSHERNYYWDKKKDFARIQLTPTRIVILNYGIFFQFIKQLNLRAETSFRNSYTIEKENYEIENLNTRNYVIFKISGSKAFYFFIINEIDLRTIFKRFINELNIRNIRGWRYE